jgi:hypothetical protein
MDISMSTSEEIAEVYNTDIIRMSKIVYNKAGITPFFAGLTGYSVFNLYSGVIPVFANINKTEEANVTTSTWEKSKNDFK